MMNFIFIALFSALAATIAILIFLRSQLCVRKMNGIVLQTSNENAVEGRVLSDGRSEPLVVSVDDGQQRDPGGTANPGGVEPSELQMHMIACTEGSRNGELDAADGAWNWLGYGELAPQPYCTSLEEYTTLVNRMHCSVRETSGGIDFEEQSEGAHTVPA